MFVVGATMRGTHSAERDYLLFNVDYESAQGSAELCCMIRSANYMSAYSA